MSKPDQVPENSRSGSSLSQHNMEASTTSCRSTTPNPSKSSTTVKGFNLTRRPWIPHSMPDRHLHHSSNYNSHNPVKHGRSTKISLTEQRGSVLKMAGAPCSSKISISKSEEEARSDPQNGPSSKQTCSTTETTLHQISTFTRNSHKNSIFTPIICSTSLSKPHTDPSEPSLVVTPRFVSVKSASLKCSDSSNQSTDRQDVSKSSNADVLTQSLQDLQSKSPSTQGDSLYSEESVPAVSHSQSTEHMIPFVQGSVIQLGGGDLKCVEDISTTDLVQSAELSDNLKMESCTVSKISKKNNENIILQLVLESGKEQIQIESSFEHPFFVVNSGWASCNPDKTKGLYNLECKALLVGDVCLFLVPKEDKVSPKNSTKSLVNLQTSSEPDKTGKKIVISDMGNKNKDILTGKEDGKVNQTCKKSLTRKRRWSTSDV